MFEVHLPPVVRLFVRLLLYSAVLLFVFQPPVSIRGLEESPATKVACGHATKEQKGRILRRGWRFVLKVLKQKRETPS
jgi:hypothetical protein